MVARNHYVSALVLVPHDNLKDWRPQFIRSDGSRAVAKLPSGKAAPNTGKAQSVKVESSVTYRWNKRGGAVDEPTQGTATEAALPPWWTFHMPFCDPDTRIAKSEWAGFEVVGCAAYEKYSVLDDGKTAELVVGGVKQARAQNLSAVVYLQSQCKENASFVPVRSKKVAVDLESKVARVSFPSLKTLAREGCKGEDSKSNARPPKVYATLFAGEPIYASVDNAGSEFQAWYSVHLRDVVLREIKAEEKKIDAVVTQGAKNVTVDRLGRGQTTILLDNKGKDVTLKVSGADLVGAKLGGDGSGVAAEVKKGNVVLGKAGAWRLYFENAVPEATIELTLTRDKVNKKVSYQVRRAPQGNSPKP